MRMTGWERTVVAAIDPDETATQAQLAERLDETFSGRECQSPSG